MSLSRWDRIEGGIVGLLIGDALGVPYEFHSPSALPPTPLLEMHPPDGFHRAHHGIAPGTWSDDGAHALCLLASLLEKERLELDDLGRRLVDWHERGYMAVDGKVFDVGIQTSTALRALAGGVLARQAGRTDERANGNGSLMRMLPLALWHGGSDEDLVRDAHEQSLVTHGHPRSQACCALYALWARRELEGGGLTWPRATEALRAIYRQHYPVHLRELETEIAPDAPPAGGGTGYVVDCLHSARLACESGTYEGVVRAAIALGHDTDTTACVAGGIAGIRHGVRGIPPRWLSTLRGRELLEPLLARFRALRAIT